MTKNTTPKNVAYSTTDAPSLGDKSSVQAEVRRVSGNSAVLRFESARVTHAVETLEMVGKESTYPSWGAYAAVLGTSAGNVTALRRLGVLVATKNLTPSHKSWGLLSDLAGDKSVGEAIRADGMTLAKVVAVATEVRNNKRDAAAAKRGPKAPASAKEDGAKESGDQTPTEVTLTPVQIVTRAVDLLAKNVADLTPEEWATVESRLADIVAKEVQIRTKAATDAAKVAAKRTTAKRVVAKVAAAKVA